MSVGWPSVGVVMSVLRVVDGVRLVRTHTAPISPSQLAPAGPSHLTRAPAPEGDEFEDQFDQEHNHEAHEDDVPHFLQVTVLDGQHENHGTGKHGQQNDGFEYG